MGLQLRNKTPKRRVKAKLRDDRKEATQVNGPKATRRGKLGPWIPAFARTSLVHDQLATGNKIRILTVVDTFSRYSPAVVPRFNFRAPDVIDVLDRVCKKIGYPKNIRVDQGSEFVSKELDQWAYYHSVTLDFSRPGKPTDNAFIESFNGKFRAECLNVHWFMSLADASTKCESWRRDYNEYRPHSAIGNKVPSMLQNMVMAPGPT